MLRAGPPRVTKFFLFGISSLLLFLLCEVCLSAFFRVNSVTFVMSSKLYSNFLRPIGEDNHLLGAPPQETALARIEDAPLGYPCLSWGLRSKPAFKASSAWVQVEAYVPWIPLDISQTLQTILLKTAFWFEGVGRSHSTPSTLQRT